MDGEIFTEVFFAENMKSLLKRARQYGRIVSIDKRDTGIIYKNELNLNS